VVSRISDLLLSMWPDAPFRAGPLTGGLDFNRYQEARNGQRSPGELQLSPTFTAESNRRGRAPWWSPAAVAVLTDNGTFSSGYTIAADLVRAGAVVIGTASSQSGNCFGDHLPRALPHSRLTLLVSFEQFNDWPDDPDRGHLLRPDSHFDPNTSLLKALHWISQQASSRQPA
jgi:hypothetical protein